MSQITLPVGYNYTIAAVVSTFWVTAYQAVKVGRARKHAKIEYPQLYAEKAEAAASKEAQVFNCTQRAHQNTLEWLPQVITSTLIVGLKYPIPAAVACGVWSVARILYTIGYSSGNPAKRNLLRSANVNGLVLVGLILGGSSYTAFRLLTEA